MPNIRSMKRFCPTTSPFGNQRISPLRMMFIASYPAMEFSALSAERNPWLAITRFFTKRWSCSMMLFMYCEGRHRQFRPRVPVCFSSPIADA